MYQIRRFYKFASLASCSRHQFDLLDHSLVDFIGEIGELKNALFSATRALPRENSCRLAESNDR